MRVVENSPGVRKIMGRDNLQELKVSGGTDPNSTAGAIMNFHSEGIPTAVVGIGAGAVNQMMKATIIASGMAAQKGLSLTLKPGFKEVTIKGQSRTAIIAYVLIRRL